MPSRRNKRKKLRAKNSTKKSPAASSRQAPVGTSASEAVTKPAQEDELDDWTAAWIETKAGNGVWGGRGRGGRGIQKRSIHGPVTDIVVEGVTLAFEANVLLERTRLMICRNRRYALIGPNGSGKSTLLRRLARGTLPGVPLSAKISYVSQELHGLSSETAVSTLVKSLEASENKRECEAKALIEEQSHLEDMLTPADGGEAVTEEEQGPLVARLCEISERLEALGVDDTTGEIRPEEHKKRAEEAKGRTQRAENILKYLGFPAKMLKNSTSTLSGGFKMRLALACACVGSPDVLCLDEPTNHLDLPGVLWLEKFLRKACPTVEEAAELKTKTTKKAAGTGKQRDVGIRDLKVKSILFVSHDKWFLDAVSTDTYVLDPRTKSLTLHPHPYGEYVEMSQQRLKNKSRIFDKASKKEAKAQAAVAKAEANAIAAAKGGKGFDQNRVKSAKQMARKAERAGRFRSDGRRYKQNVLRKLDMSLVRRAEKVSAEELKEERNIKFKFPPVDAASLRLASASAPVISLENVACGYAIKVKDMRGEIKDAIRAVLKGVSLQVALRSRVAIVGANGAGKSTLLKVLTGDLSAVRGSVTRHRNLKIAIVAQHHIDALERHLDISPVDLICKSNTNVSALDARSHLGAFGLAGKLALKKIRDLSGGQKARVSISLVTWQKPHILILDEPTNHLDMRSLDALADALNAFQGGVIVVSHNQDFLCQVCTELWRVEGGTVLVRRGSNEETDAKARFESVFQAYAKTALER
ncbi:hypothetical protein AAMO2058_000516900 [Amorphochlora amoebiformis]